MKKTLTSILAAGLFTLAGCEPESEQNPYTDLSNSGHMYRGETSEAKVSVEKDHVYDVMLKCSNDGDSDRLSIYADEIKIGQYTTEAIRTGGAGWYSIQDSPPYRFTATNNEATIKVHVDSADEWGVWPQMIKVTEAEN